MTLSISRLEFGDLVAYTWSRTVVRDGKAVTEEFPKRAIYLGYYDSKHVLMVGEEQAKGDDWQRLRGSVYEGYVESGEVVGKYKLLDGKWYDYNAPHRIVVEYHTATYKVSNHPYGGTRLAGGVWTAETFSTFKDAEEFCERNKEGKAFISIIDGCCIPGPSVRIIQLAPED